MLERDGPLVDVELEAAGGSREFWPKLDLKVDGMLVLRPLIIRLNFDDLCSLFVQECHKFVLLTTNVLDGALDLHYLILRVLTDV